jgi:Fe-S cluster assembly ATP-binding protein
MLKIDNLHARIEGKDILKGLDLEVKAGEVHAIMGPNGSGKSTLANVLAGRSEYEVTGGNVSYFGKDLLALPPEERAWKGIFLAFQYPVEIPGVCNMNFLRTALNEKRKANGEAELGGKDFLALVRERAKLVEMDPALMNRNLNVGFSGGEKKRNEIFQMAMLEPKLGILDETDSGLDIDALRIVASGVHEVRKDRPELGVVLITHYQRILDLLTPDRVHILFDGRIVESGGPELAERLEREGYEAFRD